ncbi:MAG: Fe-S cluster assembly protein SufD [Methyloligellaceae bacterium]
MTVMSTEVLKTKAEQHFADHFEQVRPSLPGDAAIQALREEAWQVYARSGLPHRRIEEWKYTDLRALLRDAYPPAPTVAEALTREAVSDALGSAVGGVDCTRLIIVDGRFRSELSDMEDLQGHGEALALEDALAAPPQWLGEVLGKTNPQEGDPVIALNTALMSGGVALRINDAAMPAKPIHIIHVQAAKDAAGLVTRNVVRIGKGAEAVLIESFVSVSAAPVQRNVVTELAVGEKARVDHLKYQAEGMNAAHLGSWLLKLGGGATYRGFQFSTGAALARNQIFLAFSGEDASSHLGSAVLLRGKQHNDTTILVDHLVPACKSREFNKLVLDGEARGIVQCKVNVHRDAQKSDGHQMAQALMLSDFAEFDSKPELEIFADDVVCGHGSTSGQVDPELMFYLRARGIPEPEARALLIASFAGEVVETVEHEGMREAFLAEIGTWLEEGGS